MMKVFAAMIRPTCGPVFRYLHWVCGIQQNSKSIYERTFPCKNYVALAKPSAQKARDDRLSLGFWCPTVPRLDGVTVTTWSCAAQHDRY